VEDEQHLLFECPLYDKLRLGFPAVFNHATISDLSELVSYDKKSADWPKVIRACCNFLALTGKIYKHQTPRLGGNVLVVVFLGGCAIWLFCSLVCVLLWVAL
jgi:hypothetical protein